MDQAFDLVAEEARARTTDPRIGAVAGALRVQNTSMTIAHAGDVRLYANVREAGSFRLFTHDHTYEHSLERARLQPLLASGAFEVHYYTPGSTSFGPPAVALLHYREKDGARSQARLEVTRGFGDVYFQPAVIHTPSVQTVALTPGTVFALCSDGARRNVGRTFAKWAHKSGSPLDLHLYVETFLAYHRKSSDDDETVIFLRLLS
jgi:serine/threonine protein phosphatase PrpC